MAPLPGAPRQPRLSGWLPAPRPRGLYRNSTLKPQVKELKPDSTADVGPDAAPECGQAFKRLTAITMKIVGMTSKQVSAMRQGGAVWDLVQQLMVYKPSKRLTAAAALRHRAFGQGVVGKAASVLSNIGDVADRVRS